jgi:hypothetical protein
MTYALLHATTQTEVSAVHQIIRSLRMYDGGVRMTAKQTF